MKISLGMILRNEGSTLERCLQSVAPYVDEIVIGLGGKSTDDTEAIARNYTQNIFSIDWNDDFAGARNQVLEKCTGDYYLWLDGDDELINGDRLRYYPEMYPEIGAFHMGYDYGRGEAGEIICYLIRERLVKREFNWKWLGRVHEVMVAEKPHEIHLIEDIVVRHNLQSEKRKSIGDRNLRILYQELEEGEPEPRPSLLYYLGNENASKGNFREALNHWNRYLRVAQWREQEYQVAHKIADIYKVMGELEKAEQAEYRAIRISPDWPDAYFGLAEIAYKREEWKAVEEWTKAGSTKAPPNTSLIINPRDYDYLPYRILGLAYAKMGAYSEALENLKNAYKIIKDDELKDVILNVQEIVKTEEVKNAFLFLYEHLGRNDEWLKAKALFTSAPKIIEKEPGIQEAYYRAYKNTLHAFDPEALEGYYGGGNDEWVPVPDEQIQDPNWRTFPRLAFASAVAGKDPKSILDVGSSDGFISLPLAMDGHRIFGLDMDPRCVDHANRRAEAWKLPAQYITGQVDDVAVPPTDKKFDLAIAFEIIEHLLDPAEFLDKLDLRAREVAITTPFLAWENGINPRWSRVEPKGHVRIFDLEDIELLLNGRGRIHNLYKQPWGGSHWIFANYVPGETWDKNITIYAPFGLEPWGPVKLKEEGLGGSETAVIKLGEALAAQGHRVTVFSPIDEPGIYNGVTYREHEKFVSAAHTDLLIAWRLPEAADVDGLRTDNLILWMHDTDAQDRLTEERVAKFKRIVVLTEWHKKNMMEVYPFIPEEKLVVIGNGLDLERFAPDDSIHRNPHRVVYSSSPDRGLDILLGFVWPEVTKAIPDAELHVYYGWDSFDVAAQLRPHLLAYKAQISTLMNQNVRVTNHGRISQEELIKEFKKSSIWLYPTYFPETFCITAIETQAAGCIPVTNHFAALAETVKSGIIIEGDVTKKEVAHRYAEAVIKLMQQSDKKLDEIRAQVISLTPAQSWTQRAEAWLTLLDA